MDNSSVLQPGEREVPRQNLLGNYAGLISRLFAFGIDVITISVTVVVITWLFNITMEMIQMRPIISYILERFPLLTTTIEPVLRPLTAGILIFSFTVLYHVLLWFFTGKTVGKALMGLRVVPLSGGRIPLWRAFLRYFGYYVSGLVLGIGFLWIIIDPRRMSWHDKLARTCVIYTWDARPDERFLLSATQRIQSRRKAISEKLSAKKKDD